MLRTLQYIFPRKIFLLYAIVVQFSCAQTPPGNNSLIPFKLIQQDFKILRTTLEEAHPALYWYIDTATFRGIYDSVYQMLDHDITQANFFKILLPAISAIRCGHTNISLPVTNPEVNKTFKKCFPMQVYFTNKKAYLIGDEENNRFNGSELVSVNDHSMGDISKTLLSCIPADGLNETFKISLLNRGAFREGYAMLFEQPDSFIIKCKPPNSDQLITSKVAARDLKELNLRDRKNNPEKLHLQFINGDTTAVLTLNSFEINPRQFADTMHAIFKTIRDKNSKNLIIDVRQNGGGISDNVSGLFAYLARKPFLHLKAAQTNTVDLTYRSYVTNPSVLTVTQGNSPTEGKHLVNDRYAGTKWREPAKKLAFSGKVIVLTSGMTNSAASEFVAIARYNKRAIIVGEETGGCYYGATGGSYVNLQLPASKLRVRIPLIQIWNAVEDDFNEQPKGRGVLPDYEVQRSINDVISKRDIVLKTAISKLH